MGRKKLKVVKIFFRLLHIFCILERRSFGHDGNRPLIECSFTRNFEKNFPLKINIMNVQVAQK